MQQPECNEYKEEKNRTNPKVKAEECRYDIDESRLLLSYYVSACHHCRQKLLGCDEKRPHCTTCVSGLKKERCRRHEKIGGQQQDGRSS